MRYVAKPDICAYTGKLQMKKGAAKKRAEEMKLPHQVYDAYLCKYCDKWHVGRHLRRKTLAKIHEVGKRPPKVYEKGGKWR